MSEVNLHDTYTAARVQMMPFLLPPGCLWFQVGQRLKELYCRAYVDFKLFLHVRIFVCTLMNTHTTTTTTNYPVRRRNEQKAVLVNTAQYSKAR